MVVFDTGNFLIKHPNRLAATANHRTAADAPDIARAGDGVTASVSVSGSGSRPSNSARVWLVDDDSKYSAIPIRAGENDGRTLADRNIVRRLTALGTWARTRATFSLPKMQTEPARAILVQSGVGGPVLAARKIECLSPSLFGCNQKQGSCEQDWTDVRPDEAEFKALMISALDGDQHAYRQLLRRLVPILRQYLGRRVSSGPEDVEDIVQETLLAVDTRRITYDRARPFTPWVFAIAHHKFVDLVRRGRMTAVLTDDLIGEHGSGDAIMAEIDVGNLLDTLPPKQAEAIRAVKLDELSVAEAAERQNIGESDIKVSIHGGLKSLIQKIGRQ